MSFRKFEFSTSNCLYYMYFVSIFGAETNKNLSIVISSSSTNRLTIQVAHFSQNPIHIDTWKHLIDTQKTWKRLRTNFDYVCILTHHFCKMIIDSNTESFKCFRTDLLLFVTFQIGDKRKDIYMSSLFSAIKILNLLVWYTRTMPWFDVQNCPTLLNF